MNALRLLLCLFASYPIASGFARSQDADKEISNSIGMKLVRIPAGKFVMGSPASLDSRTASGDSFCSRAFCSGVADASMRV